MTPTAMPAFAPVGIDPDPATEEDEEVDVGLDLAGCLVGCLVGFAVLIVEAALEDVIDPIPLVTVDEGTGVDT